MSLIRDLLADEHRFPVSRANHAASVLLGDPRAVPAAMEVLASGGPVSRARAADAIEKASRKRAELFRPYFSGLVELAEETSEPALLWHLAAILPRVSGTAGEVSRVASVLSRLLRSESALVRVFALQGLADLAGVHGRFRPAAARAIRAALASPHASVRARGRKLARKWRAVRPANRSRRRDPSPRSG